MAKIDKSKQHYRYSGAPKSYWDFAKRKARRWIPKNEKESDFDKQKRLAREDHLREVEKEINKRRNKNRIGGKS